MKKSFLNEEDYLRIFQSVMGWSNWQKKIVNEQLLISKHSVKTLIHSDDTNKEIYQNILCKKNKCLKYLFFL